MQEYNQIIENPPNYKVSLTKVAYKVTIQQKILGMAKPTNTTVQYKLEISKNGQLDYDTWKKTDFILNNSKNIAKMDELYLKTAKPLNDIQFRVNKHNTIADLNNYKKIIASWEQQKKLISKEYTGDVVKLLLQKMTAKIADYKSLKQNLSNDVILQLFLNYELDDYLIYYGRNNDQIHYKGLLNTIELPFKRNSTLGLKGKALHLQASALLNTQKIDTQKVTDYFKNKITNFNIQNLHASITSDLQLNYNTIWIEEATINHRIWVAETNYEKEIIVKLKKCES